MGEGGRYPTGRLSPHNVIPLLIGHTPLLDDYASLSLVITSPFITIISILLVMQATQSPLVLAVASYDASLNLAEDIRPSIRQIAADFHVPHSTLSYRINGATRPHS